MATALALLINAANGKTYRFNGVTQAEYDAALEQGWFRRENAYVSLVGAQTDLIPTPG